MDIQPKVSVIIPIYNGEKYLAKCLDDVCSQTLDIEVICIDDCSADNSLSIMKEYAEKFECVRIIQQPENMGAGPARNAGLEAARGEYIAFMDADDAYPDHTTLQRLYDAAVAQNAMICGGGLLFLSADGIVPGKSGDEVYSFEENGWVEYKDCQQFFFYQRFIFKNEMLRENHITFPPYLRFQDPPFFVKAMVTAQSFYALKEPVYVYRNDSNHVNWTDKKVNDYLKGALDVMELCREHKLDRQYYQMLHRFLNNKYSLGILENSLFHGNDEVLTFYRKAFENLDYELLGDGAEQLDLQYGEIMAKASLNRNMVFNHRPLEVKDANEDADRPKVSVVIPVYNMEKYISLCVGSIVGQTLEDIEIICVNDGSTDGSADVLDKLARRYKNISVYYQENSGLSAARNTGIQHARGEYVYFMDSDDYMDLTALESLYDMAKADQLDIIYFGGQSFFESPDDALTKAGQYFVNAYKRNGLYPSVVRGTEMLGMQHRNKDYYTSVCIQFYRTQFIRDNDLGFYEGILHEDNLFTLSAMIAAKRVRCIGNIYFYRRVRQGSIMSTPVNYRNLLGYYLTIVEAAKLYKTAGLSKQEADVFADKMKTVMKNNLGAKWQSLHRADKTLFMASLPEDERVKFEFFVLPMFEYAGKHGKSAGQNAVAKDTAANNKRIEALKEKNRIKIEALKEKNRKLQKEIKQLRQSNSWKIGRMVTWLPRKVLGVFRRKRK